MEQKGNPSGMKGKPQDANPREQGDSGNIKQNTTNQGRQQDR